MQNFPVLYANSFYSQGYFNLAGELDSEPNGTYKVQFFINPRGDARCLQLSVSAPAGYVGNCPSTGTTTPFLAAQGRALLGEVNVTTDVNGHATYATAFAGDLSGNLITATATRVDDLLGPLDTSEFSQALQVNYAFVGFFPPVDNPGEYDNVFNSMKAGATVPVKFSLTGNQGLGIMAAGYPQSVQIACPSSGAVLDAVDQISTASTSGLQYDPLTDKYVYTWKTEKSWTNTCRQLTINLIDGTSHTANFWFTK